MKFFKKLRKRKEYEEISFEGKQTIEEYLGGGETESEYEEEEVIEELERTEIQKAYRTNSQEEYDACIEELTVQKQEAEQQLTEQMEEYARIGTILNDVQRIAEISEEDKQELSDAALQIEELNKERKQFQRKENKINEKQYQRMEEYAKDMSSVLSKLEEDEAYRTLIEQDMRHLEAEKATIRYEKDELLAKRSIAKKAVEWAVVLFGISIVFYGVCIVLLKENYDMFLYVMLGVVGILLTITFLLYQKAVKALKFCDRKLKRAVSLLNTSKARYVGVENSLQYRYGKYGVKNSQELKHLWELYREEKQNRERYRASSDQLHGAEKTVLGILSEYFVEQPRFWITYATALIDTKEMVEVRHDLNGRRKMLRERMENSKQIADQAEIELQRFEEMNRAFALEQKI